MFSTRTTELDGSLVVGAPIEAAFALFSPLGERAWVPGWEPEFIHPAGSAWEPGLVFRTHTEHGEALWVVAALDRLAHKVEYLRFEAERYVVKLRVACSVRSRQVTDVRVTYMFIGLSDVGNEEIASMSPDAHAERMLKWQGWIAQYLERQSTLKAEQP
jgi:hypothetical protein